MTDLNSPVARVSALQSRIHVKSRNFSVKSSKRLAWIRRKYYLFSKTARLVLLTHNRDAILIAPCNFPNLNKINSKPRFLTCFKNYYIFAAHTQCVLGEWITGKNAGGQVSNQTFGTNPQFHIDIPNYGMCAAYLNLTVFSNLLYDISTCFFWFIWLFFDKIITYYQNNKYHSPMYLS